VHQLFQWKKSLSYLLVSWSSIFCDQLKRACR
jgi:hypothetical protein